jgi:putative transposase
MKLCRTTRFKINIEASKILPSLKAYTKAFNLVSATGYKNKIYNAIDLHKLTYTDCRELFNLPSQLAISARSKAVEALKGIQKKKYAKCPRSELCSIRLDCNSYTLFKDNTVSILTLDGRKKFKLEIPDFYKEYFSGWKNTSADLIIRKNTVYLHISFEKDITDTAPNGKFLGIDRGIKKLAVTSDNKFYSGTKINHVSQRYGTIRRKLQKKGTKSAKRHLKLLSGKEKRFKADINHNISKQIVNSLNLGDTIALEKLKNIRNLKAGNKHRTALNSWNFYQLEQFLTYKAIAKGISVIKVNAAYTSQKCSRCGKIDKKNRKTQSEFCCTKCGFKLNADLNASRNISAKALESYKLSNGAVVNQPIVAIPLV